MKKFIPSIVTFSRVLAVTLAFAFPARGANETESSDKAQTLLQEVKSRDFERQKADKQKEVDRLTEDLDKQRKESDETQKSVEAMSYFRSYGVNYGAGEAVVRTWIEGPDATRALQWKRLATLLSEPTTPAAENAGPCPRTPTGS